MLIGGLPGAVLVVYPQIASSAYKATRVVVAESAPGGGGGGDDGDGDDGTSSDSDSKSATGLWLAAAMGRAELAARWPLGIGCQASRRQESARYRLTTTMDRVGAAARCPLEAGCQSFRPPYWGMAPGKIAARGAGGAHAARRSRTHRPQLSMRIKQCFPTVRLRQVYNGPWHSPRCRFLSAAAGADRRLDAVRQADVVALFP